MEYFSKNIYAFLGLIDSPVRTTWMSLYLLLCLLMLWSLNFNLFQGLNSLCAFKSNKVAAWQ